MVWKAEIHVVKLGRVVFVFKQNPVGARMW